MSKYHAEIVAADSTECTVTVQVPYNFFVNGKAVMCKVMYLCDLTDEEKENLNRVDIEEV